MRKLRLSLSLPLIQFLVAAILLQWGYRTPVPPGSEAYVPTSRLICRGLNAPALLFRIFDPFVWGQEWTRIPRSLLGFDTGDVPFLVGVIVLWYLVARGLEKKETLKITDRSRKAAVLAAISLLSLGLFLASVGLHDLGPGRPNNTSPPVGAVLTLVWSIALIFLSCREIAALPWHSRKTETPNVALGSRCRVTDWVLPPSMPFRYPKLQRNLGFGRLQ